MDCMAVPFWLNADAKPVLCKTITLLKPYNFLFKIKCFFSPNSLTRSVS